MSKRIKELAIQAGFKTEEDEVLEGDGWHIQTDIVEKFAELIVRECLDIAEDEDDGSADTKSVRLAMIKIKTHFGVEE